MTEGTKTPAILSAVFWMGAFELVASSTSAMMPASTVSSPVLVTLMVKYPDWTRVAPVTSSPSCLPLGTLSPVMVDSSMEAPPSSTSPSSGTVSPARTTSMSPTCTCSMGSSVSTPSRRTFAVLGARSMSLERASVVRPLARASKYFPTVMSVRIMPALSK